MSAAAGSTEVHRPPGAAPAPCPPGHKPDSTTEAGGKQPPPSGVPLLQTNALLPKTCRQTSASVAVLASARLRTSQICTPIQSSYQATRDKVPKPSVPGELFRRLRPAEKGTGLIRAKHAVGRCGKLDLPPVRQTSQLPAEPGPYFQVPATSCFNRPCSGPLAAARNWASSSRNGPPLGAVTTPPASWTISTPAATSQIFAE